MHRRAFLATAAGVVTAGCSALDSGGETTATPTRHRSEATFSPTVSQTAGYADQGLWSGRITLNVNEWREIPIDAPDGGLLFLYEFEATKPVDGFLIQHEDLNAWRQRQTANAINGTVANGVTEYNIPQLMLPEGRYHLIVDNTAAFETPPHDEVTVGVSTTGVVREP